MLNHACDDGNNIDGDGCNSTCSIEDGFTCMTVFVPTRCSEVCGDGFVHLD